MQSKPKLKCPNCNKEVGWHQSHLEKHINSQNCKTLNTDFIKNNDMYVCLHCNKESNDSANMHKNHGVYCKSNPNRIIKEIKLQEILTCPNCNKDVRGASNLIQHMKGSKCKKPE